MFYCSKKAGRALRIGNGTMHVVSSGRARSEGTGPRKAYALVPRSSCISRLLLSLVVIDELTSPQNVRPASGRSYYLGNEKNVSRGENRDDMCVRV